MNSESDLQLSGQSLAGFVSACNETGIRLLLELERADPGGNNPLVSPLSIALSLSMLYEGAGQETRRLMAEALGFESLTRREFSLGCRALLTSLSVLPPDDLSVVVANALWTSHAVRLKEHFKHALRRFHDAELRSLDFSDPSAVTLINDWVRDKTDGKIGKLLDSSDLSSVTDCIMTSTAYFKGKWSLPFQKDLTRPEPFHLAGDTTCEIPMMSQTSRLSVIERRDFKAVRLPYAGESCAMYVFLPAPGSTLEDFHKTVSASALGAWTFEFEEELVKVKLPRFGQSFRADLKEALVALNLGTLFTHQADFSPMGLGEHHIEKIKHQVRAEIGEEGTTAMAATAVIIGRSLQSPPVLNFNRPFFWIIRDERTGILFFAGWLMNPGP